MMRSSMMPPSSLRRTDRVEENGGRAVRSAGQSFMRYSWTLGPVN